MSVMMSSLSTQSSQRPWQPRPAWLSRCSYWQCVGAPGLEAPIRSVAWRGPSACRDAAAEDDEYPSSQQTSQAMSCPAVSGTRPGQAGSQPLQVIAFDDDGARDVAISTPLPLRPRIDEDRATADGPERQHGVKPLQTRRCPGRQIAGRGRYRPGCDAHQRPPSVVTSTSVNFQLTS